MKLQCQRFRALELSGYDEYLAHAGERAVDKCVVTETARQLEVLLKELKWARFSSCRVQSPGQLVARCSELRLVPDCVPELDCELKSTSARRPQRARATRR